jgi:hypothetical protein
VLDSQHPAPSFMRHAFAMTYFQCPYLSNAVELSDERKKHIADNHPDLLPQYEDRIPAVLRDPDQIRISERFKNARLFSKWFDNTLGGKYIVIVVVSEGWPANRHWIITAYISSRLSGGRIEWKKN